MIKKEYAALGIGAILLLLGILFLVSPTGNPFSAFGDEEGNSFFGNLFAAHSEDSLPAPTCEDGIQNQGERHADCGGPCEACPPDCTDGILNQDEEKIDCGGTICPACPTCTDGIQNQGEGGIDCGGPCPIACPPTCTDGILNQGEIGVDCGGPCAPCPPAIITSLTPDEVAKVRDSILSSEFVSALPKDGIISLHFFNYQNGQRVELDTFIIGKDEILTSGTPDISVILHSKYIAELTPTNLCDIITKARAGGDIAFETYESDTKLLLKYSGMIKYKDCMGF
jgi:hypothetical protein